MKIVKVIGIGVVVLVVLVVGVSMLLPSHAHVERSADMSVPAEAVFPHVADYRNWGAWSPWAERDPNMKLTFDGPPTGIGARMIWESDQDDVGSGMQETTDVEANRLFRSHLDFGDQGQADAYFKFEPMGKGCRVTWGFDSELGINPIARFCGLLFDKMIGPDYEKGLANLKAIAEATL